MQNSTCGFRWVNANYLTNCDFLDPNIGPFYEGEGGGQ